MKFIYFKISSFPENGIPCPLEDVLYVLNTGPDLAASGNHFCTITFMPLSQTIYVFGRRYGDDYQNYDDTDRNSWDGTHIWTILRHRGKPFFKSKKKAINI